MINFDILNRYTGCVIFTAEIDCGESRSRSIKLGLAVQAAVKVGAHLYEANLDGAKLDGSNLAGANLYAASLVGSNLYGSDLAGASLNGANLNEANLVRAKLYGVKWGFVRPIAIAARMADPYQFTIWRSLWGGHAVKAGCHLFSLSEYRAHVERKYPGTEKAAETLAILDYLEARLTAQAVAV